MLRQVSVAVILLVSSRSSADPFADAAKESSGQYSVAYSLTKLTTWKLGKKCQARLADKNEGAIHAASYYGRDIAEYAKAVTGDDWSAIEGSDNTTREANKDKIAAKIGARKPEGTVLTSVTSRS